MKKTLHAIMPLACVRCSLSVRCWMESANDNSGGDDGKTVVTEEVSLQYLQEQWRVLAI